MMTPRVLGQRLLGRRFDPAQLFLGLGVIQMALDVLLYGFSLPLTTQKGFGGPSGKLAAGFPGGPALPLYILQKLVSQANRYLGGLSHTITIPGYGPSMNDRQSVVDSRVG